MSVAGLPFTLDSLRAEPLRQTLEVRHGGLQGEKVVRDGIRGEILQCVPFHRGVVLLVVQEPFVVTAGETATVKWCTRLT